MPNVQATYDYHEYLRTVTWTVHKTGRLKADDFIIGIEHELECGGTDVDNAIEITTAMGFPCDQTHDVIVSEDGSLRSGWEFITHPATYSFHMNVGGKGYDWEAALKKADELGYVGEGSQDGRGNWHGGRAGTHFNVSRASLMGKGDTEHNLLLLLNNNKDWIMERFSRRRNTCNEFFYCRFQEGDKITPKMVRDNFESVQSRLADMAQKSRDHYAALNLSKDQVIEFRFMTSTTFYKWFVAGLQLIVMMCWCSKHMTLEEIAGVRFPFFLQRAKAAGFTQFVEYCAYHRINIKPTDYPA